MSLIFDAHLDLSMNAIEWNRDLTQSVAELRRREEGKKDKPDRGRGTVSLPEMRNAGIGLCVATQIARVEHNAWSPVPGWEWGTAVPAPTTANTVYATGSGVVKIMYPSEQWINVSPAVDPSRRLRTTSSAPIVFAPWNKKMLLAAFQSVWSTIAWQRSIPMRTTSSAVKLRPSSTISCRVRPLTRSIHKPALSSIRSAP